MEDVSETRAAAPQTRGVLEFVKDAPINSLAIALGAGFIWGGGATTRAGLALLAFVGRMALREAGVQLLKGKAYDSPRRNFGSGSGTG
jgi:hypothetical protein